jgi:hypothetical protein
VQGPVRSAGPRGPCGIAFAWFRPRADQRRSPAWFRDAALALIGESHQHRASPRRGASFTACTPRASAEGRRVRAGHNTPEIAASEEAEAPHGAAEAGGSRRSEEISPRRHASRSTTPLIGALLSCGHAASRDPDGRRTGAVCVVAGAACVSRPVQTCRTPCARVSGYPVGTGGCRAIRFRAALCGVVISGPCRSFSSKPPLGRGLRLPW